MSVRLLLLVLLPAVAFSQSDTASLSGAVTDPSAAAVVGAKVTLKNQSTGSQRVAMTDIQGLYHFSLLIPGPYQITVEAHGLKQYDNQGLQLQVAEAQRLDVQLEIGSMTEVVEVNTPASPLTTETVAQGTLVSEEKIESLPLNGRQFLQLALLVPGANAGGRSVQQSQYRQGMMGGLSISGGRTNNTGFMLDGAIDIDPDYSSLNYEPNIDSIAEFQVQTAMVPAEYGRASGGQINVVSKSGGNSFHGSAWEFLRNNDLDARPFNLPTANVPEFRRNQFGAVLGGPILKQKLFVFLSYEGLRLAQAAAGLTTVTVPSALQRAGDFSMTKGGIFDPATLQSGVRSPFPQNVIPASRINATAMAAVNALPMPNIGTSLYVNSSEALRQNNDNYSVRIDYDVARGVTMFGRYSLATENAVIPSPVTARDNLNDVRPQNGVMGVTSTLPHGLINETRAAFSRFHQLNGLPEINFTVNGQSTHVPEFLVSGYPTMGGAGSYTGTTGGGIYLVRDNTYQLYDNVYWQHGRHAVKFGGEALNVRYNRFEQPSVLGNYNFTNGFTTRTANNDGTGDALASLYLALPSAANRAIGPSRIDGQQWNYSAYIQDDIRLAQNLMVNVGLRYELAPPLSSTRGQMSSIDYSNVPSPQAVFASGKTAFYMPTMFVCGQSGYPKGCAHTDFNNFAPRVGLAWSVTHKTVVRAGGGVFYANSDLNPLFRLAAGLPGNLAQALSSNNFIPAYSGFDIFGPAVVGPVQIQAAGIDENQRTSYSLQWTFTVQRELRRNLVMEAGYLASLGLKLEQNVQPNNSLPGTAAVDPRRPYLALQYAPGTQFPSYMSVVGNSVPVGFINYLPHSAQSNYHSLFVRFERPLAAGFSWLGSYTFSKAITNAPQFRNAGGANGSENSPPQNSFDLRSERGLASFDVRNRMVHTLVYQLPFGRSKRYLRSGLPSRILGGWEASGIVSMQSGFPFTVNLKGDTAGVGAGTGGIYVRPIAVPGATYELPSNLMSTARYFNTAAFLMPANGTFGNTGRNTVIGPGLTNADVTLGRNIRISEGVRLQFRGEFFNALNHPNYNLVGRIINDPTFGQVLSQFDPRELQFGIKVIY